MVQRNRNGGKLCGWSKGEEKTVLCEKMRTWFQFSPTRGQRLKPLVTFNNM